MCVSQLDCTLDSWQRQKQTAMNCGGCCRSIRFSSMLPTVSWFANLSWNRPLLRRLPVISRAEALVAALPTVNSSVLVYVLVYHNNRHNNTAYTY
jgi:hypothetical protein